MTVYLDLDGVLYSWTGGVCKLFNINPTDYLSIITQYGGLEDMLGKQEIDKRINEAGQGFWANLDPLPWANKLYHSLCDKVGKDNVYFCTSHGSYASAPNGKITAVMRDFGASPKKVILIKDKYLLAKPQTILIDDFSENLDKFDDINDESVIGWLWPNEYEIKAGKVNADKEIDDIIAEVGKYERC
jgi:hypothetical protein